MRKTKLITINEKDITVKEMRNRDWKTLYDTLNTKDGIKATMEDFKEYLKLFSETNFVGFGYEEFLDLTPSEAEEVVTAWREVNAAFLGRIETLGIKKIFEGVMGVIHGAIVRDFARLFVSLSGMDTTKRGITDGSLQK